MAQDPQMIFELRLNDKPIERLDFETAVERYATAVDIDTDVAFADLEAAFWAVFAARENNPHADANPEVDWTDDAGHWILSPAAYNTGV